MRSTNPAPSYTNLGEWSSVMLAHVERMCEVAGFRFWRRGNLFLKIRLASGSGLERPSSVGRPLPARAISRARPQAPCTRKLPSASAMRAVRIPLRRQRRAPPRTRGPGWRCLCGRPMQRAQRASTPAATSAATRGHAAASAGGGAGFELRCAAAVGVRRGPNAGLHRRTPRPVAGLRIR